MRAITKAGGNLKSAILRSIYHVTISRGAVLGSVRPQRTLSLQIPSHWLHSTFHFHYFVPRYTEQSMGPRDGNREEVWADLTVEELKL